MAAFKSHSSCSGAIGSLARLCSGQHVRMQCSCVVGRRDSQSQTEKKASTPRACWTKKGGVGPPVKEAPSRLELESQEVTDYQNPVC